MKWPEYVQYQRTVIAHTARSVQGYDLSTGARRWITKCATTELFIKGNCRRLEQNGRTYSPSAFHPSNATR